MENSSHILHLYESSFVAKSVFDLSDFSVSALIELSDLLWMGFEVEIGEKWPLFTDFSASVSD